jgi:hypothetical protein
MSHSSANSNKTLQFQAKTLPHEAHSIRSSIAQETRARAAKREEKCSTVLFIHQTPSLPTCYMTSSKSARCVFLRSFALHRSVGIEKNSKNTKKKIFSLYFLEWPRARDEKSRLEFYFSISLQNRHSSGSAVVSCLRSLLVNSRTFDALLKP